MGLTAAELMAKLKQDKEFQGKARAREEETKQQQAIFDKDQAELLDELSQLGYKVNSVWDFVNSPNDYMSAVPVLKKHLQISHHPRILSGIARSLAIAELSDDNELWNILVELYKATPSDVSISIPVERGAQESIAAALRVLANPSRVGCIESLLVDYPNGDGADHFKFALERLASRS